MYSDSPSWLTSATPRSMALASSGCGRAPVASPSVDQEREDREGEDGETDDERRDPLTAAERLDGQVLGPVDAEEHQHEEEQDDDGAGVDDHLHRGQEVGLLGDEEDRDPEQRADERERGVHGVAVRAPRRAHRRCTRRRRRGRRRAPSVVPPAVVVVRLVGLGLRPRARGRVWPELGRLHAEAELAGPGDHARRSRRRRTGRWRAPTRTSLAATSSRSDQSSHGICCGRPSSSTTSSAFV